MTPQMNGKRAIQNQSLAVSRRPVPWQMELEMGEPPHWESQWKGWSIFVVEVRFEEDVRVASNLRRKTLGPTARETEAKWQSQFV